MVAVCDIIPERAKDYAEKFNVPAWYTSIDELLEKCDFEILMNTTSIPAHHEINMKALNAGKHLYSQKPVGLTVAEVTEQIEAAKAAGVKYTCLLYTSQGKSRRCGNSEFLFQYGSLHFAAGGENSRRND